MKQVKNRTLSEGLRVYVYYNLHQHVFSVKALEGPDRGKVIAHASSLTLSNCKFKVSEKGRQRVLKEKRKNVHAGIVGKLSLSLGVTSRATTEITYNPYLYESFVTKDHQEPIKESRLTYFIENKVYIA
jgi:hypothetical protein